MYLSLKFKIIANLFCLSLGWMFVLVQTAFAQTSDIPNHTFSYLTSAEKVIRINLDTIVPTEMRNVSTKDEQFMRNGESYFHGRLVSSTLFNGKIFLADNTHQHIYQVGDNDDLKWVAGRNGRGPGEFLDLISIDANKYNLFAQDRAQLKAIVFNRNMETVGEIQIGSVGNIAAGNHFILVPSSFSSSYFFYLKDSEPPFNTVGNFLEHIIPAGMQPSGYRVASSAVNPISHSLFHIQGLPYLFFFDEKFNHITTLKLESELITEIIQNNPEPRPVANLDFPAARVSNIITAIHFTDESLMISVRRSLYKFEYKDGMVTHQKTYQFYDSSSSEEPDVLPLGLYDVFITDETKDICIVAPFYEQIYCYPFTLN